MTDMELEKLFQSFRKIKVGVVGDVMLDSYFWGNVERVSPEAPVPIVSLNKKELRIGGAGNVALNLRTLGAKPYLLSIIGEDADGDSLTRLLKEQDIDATYSCRTGKRITTNKIRVISRNQQMLRMDAEVTHDLEPEDEAQFIDAFEKFVAREKPHAVILQDYNKGVLTEAVIRVVVDICREKGILSAVDPKRKNFLQYRGVDIFKPNLKEVKDALNLLSLDTSLPMLEQVHRQLHHLLHHKLSFITLSEKGVFYASDEQQAVIPSHLRNIADVSGAGDTVIATAALVYAASKNVHLMAEIANIAGGMVCEEVGTAAINGRKLLHECELLLT